MTSPFTFDNTYLRDLPGFTLQVKGDDFPAPAVLRLNEQLARELGLEPAGLRTDAAAGWFTGATLPEGAAGAAMAYAGHQFGGFSPQLGDGRALLLGEVLDESGARRDIHLKGSGRTPFSRGGDGKAVLGPVLREYLIGEAMHSLGIPSTRALAVSVTGEAVYRDGQEPGAVLARVASSHLRVGTFQFFAARGEADKVRQLADYAIARHYPQIGEGEERYLTFFRAVRDAQAALVAKWVSVGFVHGVMNTDNMTISGETIDYGPCAFIDAYDPAAVFSSIDRNGRYAYGNQPAMAQWNLARLAESLIGLIGQGDDDAAVKVLTEEISVFPEIYQARWLEEMRRKLGLSQVENEDIDLANDLHKAMEDQNVDFTGLFRSLADVLEGNDEAARALFDDPEAGFDAWLEAFRARHAREVAALDMRAASMRRVNPVYIPRNHLVEEALEQASAGDLSAFDALLERVTAPFEDVAGAERFAMPAPEGFGPYTTFCGT